MCQLKSVRRITYCTVMDLRSAMIGYRAVCGYSPPFRYKRLTYTFLTSAVRPCEDHSSKNFMSHQGSSPAFILLSLSFCSENYISYDPPALVPEGKDPVEQVSNCCTAWSQAIVCGWAATECLHWHERMTCIVGSHWEWDLFLTEHSWLIQQDRP